VGKFIGKDVPAVGFSIGFERIYSILAEKNVKIPHKPRLAVIYEDDNFVESMVFAEEQKESYDVAFFSQPKKLGKLLSSLEEEDFDAYVVLGEGKEIKKLGKK
jgi:histidyl-tRNA synthetase